MSALEIKELEEWATELHEMQFKHNGQGSNARHTEEAFQADRRSRLLAKVLRELRNHEPAKP